MQFECCLVVLPVLYFYMCIAIIIYLFIYNEIVHGVIEMTEKIN